MLQQQEYCPVLSVVELPGLMKDFNVNQLLKSHAYVNKPLSFEGAYALGVYALAGYSPMLQELLGVSGETAEKQSIAALCSFHNRHTYSQPGAAAQIAGICAAIFDYDIGQSERGFLSPKTPFVMDNCGMGGDMLRTPNVSTIAALIAAADGVPVCKHGSPGNTDSTGSSDFLRYLGVDLYAHGSSVERGVEECCFGYTEALDTAYKRIHKQTHMSAHLAHMNDIIGPVTNPVDPRLMTRRVLGVNHLIEPRVVAEAYKELNKRGVTSLEHGLFVRGFADAARNGGMDEVSLLPGGTIVAELKSGEIRDYNLFARDFGLPETTYREIHPVGSKAEFSKQILYGERDGAPRQLVAANAAMLLYLAHGLPFADGARRAESVLASGEPVRVLERYLRILGGDAQ